MDSLSDKERQEILGEVFLDELRVIREYLSDIPHIKNDLGAIKAHIVKVDARLDEHDYDLKQLKQHPA